MPFIHPRQNKSKITSKIASKQWVHCLFGSLNNRVCGHACVSFPIVFCLCPIWMGRIYCVWRYNLKLIRSHAVVAAYCFVAYVRHPQFIFNVSKSRISICINKCTIMTMAARTCEKQYWQAIVRDHITNFVSAKTFTCQKLLWSCGHISVFRCAYYYRL